jgi:hypothetical protein
MSQSKPPEFILASYPRSANHWLRYIIEYLSKQPTLGEGNRNRDTKDPPVFKRLGMEEYYQTTEAIAVKRHRIRKDDDRSKKIIFVFRDYREVIFRHFNQPFSLFKMRRLEKHIRMYLSLIQHYHDWPSAKLMIRYENLIKDPDNTITTIAQFIDKDESLIDLLGNLTQHQERCVGMYDACKGSHTKGKSTDHHSKQYGTAWKRYLDWRIQTAYESLPK